MYEQTTVRTGYWPIVGPVFLARALGSIVGAVILASVAPLVTDGPAGYAIVISAASAESAWGIIAIACTSLAAGLVLRPLLCRMAGLEISLARAIAAFVLGNIAGVVLLTLLRPGSSSSATLPLLASIAPLALLGTIVLEVMLVQAFATPARGQAGTWRPSFLPLLLLLLVLAPAVARLTNLSAQLRLSTPSSRAASSTDIPRVDAQMSQMLQGLEQAASTAKTVASVTCSHTTRQPPGFGHDPVFTYYDCLAMYTNGQHNSWCAAYDGHQAGTYYEGPRGCRGPSYPAFKP